MRNEQTVLMPRLIQSLFGLVISRLIYYFFFVQKEHVYSLLSRVFGLIRLPCLRTSPDQQQCVYAIQQNVSNPPAPMVSSTEKQFLLYGKVPKGHMLVLAVFCPIFERSEHRFKAPGTVLSH